MLQVTNVVVERHPAPRQFQSRGITGAIFKSVGSVLSFALYYYVFNLQAIVASGVLVSCSCIAPPASRVPLQLDLRTAEWRVLSRIRAFPLCSNRRVIARTLHIKAESSALSRPFTLLWNLCARTLRRGATFMDPAVSQQAQKQRCNVKQSSDSRRV